MRRMDVYEALYTTRAMRRVKPDPIPLEVQRRVLDAAVRAPSGGNAQNWRFMLVDDPDVKASIGPIYRECLGSLWTTYYKPRVDAAAAEIIASDSHHRDAIPNGAGHARPAKASAFRRKIGERDIDQ